MGTETPIVQITMKEYPILFSGAMVRAILDGRKTQTRRVVKPQPLVQRGYPEPFPKHVGSGRWHWYFNDPRDGMTGLYDSERDATQFCQCPYGQPGDRLWVRETFYLETVHCQVCTWYRADPENDLHDGFWKPSIFMPRSACRILLEIVSVRVDRLNEISREDVIAEGIKMRGCSLAEDVSMLIPDYASLWDSLNAKRGFGWAVNPWVSVIEFKRVTP